MLFIKNKRASFATKSNLAYDSLEKQVSKAKPSKSKKKSNQTKQTKAKLGNQTIQTKQIRQAKRSKTKSNLASKKVSKSSTSLVVREGGRKVERIKKCASKSSKLNLI